MSIITTQKMPKTYMSCAVMAEIYCSYVNSSDEVDIWKYRTWKITSSQIQ